MTDVLPTTTSPKPDLDEKYRAESGSFFFTGVQGLVRLPIDQMRADRLAGLRTATFISGYQGSPLGGFDREIIGRRALMDEHHVVHRPGLNEELGATAVMGSQVATTFPQQSYDGVLGIWSGVAGSGDLMRADGASDQTRVVLDLSCCCPSSAGREHAVVVREGVDAWLRANGV